VARKWSKHRGGLPTVRVRVVRRETAEMPGFYKPGGIRFGRFCVGAVDRKDVIDGRHVRAGDIVLGLPSSGCIPTLFPHTQTLFRKRTQDALERFLAPTDLCQRRSALIKSGAKPHQSRCPYTGEGFIGNIPRVLPKGLQVRIVRGSWPVPTC